MKKSWLLGCLLLTAPLCGAVAAELDVAVVCPYCPLPGDDSFHPEPHSWILDQSTGDVWAYSLKDLTRPPVKIARMLKVGSPFVFEKGFEPKPPPPPPPESTLYLSGLFTAEKAFFGEYNTYTTDLVSLNWFPDGKSRFAYGFCNEFPKTIAGIGNYDPKRNHTLLESVQNRGRYSNASSATKVGTPCKALEKLGLASKFQVTGTAFRAFAVGDLDDDGQIEVWSIDQVKAIEQLSKD